MVSDFFESFKVGQQARSRGRTVTETDIVMFAALSGDWYPLHTDQAYAEAGPFGRRIAHGLLVLSIATGLIRLDPEMVLAFYGMDRVRFTAPTFIGDTIQVVSEVAGLTDRGERGGLVDFAVNVQKVSGETVLAATMKILVAKRPTN